MPADELDLCEVDILMAIANSDSGIRYDDIPALVKMDTPVKREKVAYFFSLLQERRFIMNWVNRSDRSNKHYVWGLTNEGRKFLIETKRI